MKAQKLNDGMVQSAVRLPQSLHEQLKKAGGTRGMGEEIRRRLEASFDAEAKAPSDPKTRELLEAISFCAEQIARDCHSWSEDAFAFEVLKRCVNMLLKHFQPKGEPVPNLKPDSLFVIDPLFSPTQPEELSRSYVRLWMMLGPMRADREKRR